MGGAAARVKMGFGGCGAPKDTADDVDGSEDAADARRRSDASVDEEESRRVSPSAHARHLGVHAGWAVPQPPQVQSCLRGPAFALRSAPHRLHLRGLRRP